MNGDEAADRSWPWQVVITKFHGKVVDVSISVYKYINVYTYALYTALFLVCIATYLQLVTVVYA